MATPAPLTAPVRVLRTTAQVVLAVCVAIPAAAAALDLSAATTAKVGGIAGAVVIVVTAIQNTLEAKAGRTLGEHTTT